MIGDSRRSCRLLLASKTTGGKFKIILRYGSFHSKGTPNADKNQNVKPLIIAVVHACIQTFKSRILLLMKYGDSSVNLSFLHKNLCTAALWVMLCVNVTPVMLPPLS